MRPVLPCHLEGQVEVRKVISDAHEGGDRDARVEDGHGRDREQEPHQPGSYGHSQERELDEIYVSCVHAALSMAEYVFSADEVVSRDGNEK